MDATEVAELMGFDPTGAPRAELERRIGRYGRAETLLAAGRLACMAELDGRGDGGVDAERVLRARTKCSAKTAKRAARTARALEHMPKARAALARGEISESHADALADAAERTSDERADDELVASAVARPADLFARHSREWAATKESEADRRARHERQRSLREAQTGTGDEGMRWFLLRLDPTTATEVDKTWREEIDRLWRADGGRDGTPDEIRTPAQRRADAMVGLLLGARTANPSRPHPRFMGVARVDIDRLRADDPAGAAAIVDGEPLPQSVLERIACDSVWAAMIFGSDGAVLWKGRDVRTATPDQWTALIARDGGCFCCGAPPHHCQAHHLDPWAPPVNGTTDIDRLVLVCSRTHHLIHDHDRTVTRVDGRWELRPPRGLRRRPAA